MKKRDLEMRLDIIEGFLGQTFQNFVGFKTAVATGQLVTTEVTREPAEDKIAEILRDHPEQCLSLGYCIGGAECVVEGCVRQRDRTEYIVDPPWFADLVAAAHRAWMGSGGGHGRSDVPINFYAIVRAVLVCHQHHSPQK